MQQDLKNWQELAEAEGLYDGVVLRCPCGRPVALGLRFGEPTVLHAVPPCTAFEDKEPDDYATYVRQAVMKDLGGESGA